VLPAAALIAVGLGALHDPRVLGSRLATYTVIATGAGSGLVTTFVQALTNGGTSWYTAWLLCEGVLLMGAAIASRVRMLAVAAAVATMAATGCALATVLPSIPLYAVFGTLAALLMVLATVLATQRSLIHEARESVVETWRGWN
jgi:hypothetical protein